MFEAEYYTSLKDPQDAPCVYDSNGCEIYSGQEVFILGKYTYCLECFKEFAHDFIESASAEQLAEIFDADLER